MLRNPELYFIAALCVLANSSVVARPAKNTPPVAPPPKQAPVRTDLTPRDKNECLAVAQTLNRRRDCLSKPNGVSRGSLLGSHRTLISHAVRRISKRRGSASNG